MPLYEIVTRDVVENVKLVEADDEFEARNLALDSGYVPNEFGQKHLGEAVQTVLEKPKTVSIQEWLDNKESEDYHIRFLRNGIAKRR